MRKDITEQLKFEEKPVLVIKGIEIEVNNDAPTMLQVMALMGEKPRAKEINGAYELIFEESERVKLKKLGLTFSGLITVVNEAVNLVVGESTGEA